MHCTCGLQASRALQACFSLLRRPRKRPHLPPLVPPLQPHQARAAGPSLPAGLKEGNDSCSIHPRGRQQQPGQQQPGQQPRRAVDASAQPRQRGRLRWAPSFSFAACTCTVCCMPPLAAMRPAWMWAAACSKLAKLASFCTNPALVFCPHCQVCSGTAAAARGPPAPAARVGAGLAAASCCSLGPWCRAGEMLPLHKELARLRACCAAAVACQLSCATPIFYTPIFTGEMLPLYEELARLLRCNVVSYDYTG